MSEKTYELAGIRLTTELIGLKPDGLPQYLARNADMLVHSERPFADYMRMKFREKGIQQQDIFLAADLSERYGYKLMKSRRMKRSRSTAWPRSMSGIRGMSPSSWPSIIIFMISMMSTPSCGRTICRPS